MNSRSIWTKLDRYPPIICRMVAVVNGKLLEDEVIAERSGLGLSYVRFLGSCSSWDTIPVGCMQKFCLACGVDFSDRDTMRRLNRYLKNPRFVAARRSNKWNEMRESLKEIL